jgi:hypothetical protein
MEDYTLDIAKQYLKRGPKPIRTQDQEILSYWRGMNSRVKKGIYKRKGIQVIWTFDEFKMFWISNTEKIQKIKNAGFVPSVDRINSDGNYELTNCRIIPNHLNTALGNINNLQGQLKKLYALVESSREWF